MDPLTLFALANGAVQAVKKGFLESVEKKLANEKFVQNAKPEVIAIEQKKKADALARIQTIEESLAQLG